MGSDFKVYIDENIELDARDTFDTVISLFEYSDLEFYEGNDARRVVEDHPYLNRSDHDFDTEGYPIVLARQTAGQLREKLHTMGYGRGGTKHIFDIVKKDLIDSNSRSIESHGVPGYSADQSELISENESLVGLSYATWFDYVTGAISDHADVAVATLSNKLLNYYHDELLLLSVLLNDIDSDKVLLFDLTDLYEYGDEFESSIEEYSNQQGAPIIITEGTTDVEFLRESIAILKPHLSPFIRFLEMDFKPETNADAVLKMAKSFAAAGISQNMLFILDNDSAATAALVSFEQIRRSLPDNFRITQYPDVPLLNSYPTKGPQGDVNLNVNGTSGSIELYLGRDVLTADSALMPVQWRGYNDKVQAYQGVVLEKRTIQDRFREKYRAIRSGSEVNLENWTEMNLLLEHLIAELSHLPATSPVKQMDGY